MLCYATSVLEPKSTSSSMADEYVDDLLGRLYSWDMSDINDLLDMLEEYEAEASWYFDNRLILFPPVDYDRIPSMNKSCYPGLHPSRVIAVDMSKRIAYRGNGIEYITDYEVVS